MDRQGRYFFVADKDRFGQMTETLSFYYEGIPLKKDGQPMKNRKPVCFTCFEKESRRRKKKAIVIESAKKIAMSDAKMKERKTKMKEQLKEGKKDSEGKTDWSFLPMDSLEGVARVFEKGSGPEQYDGRRTWLPGIMFGKLFAATMRHLFDWFYKKKDQDDKTGEHPLSHVIANCMMLLTFITNNDYDDRG